MKNRTTDPDTIGLEAWLEDTRIILPLRAVSVRADITAGFAEVAVDQLFEQNNTQPLDCRFLFPLPANAAAYRCEMHVNGRVILAKVEERAAARKHFKELKASGRRAALAESERDNLFTLQLGNLQPGDSILMRFAYVQPVQRLREQRTLRIPVNPGVRYIPGEPLLRDNTGPGTVDDTNLVPDASRITPPRIDPEHADAAALHATVRLHGAGDLADGASSPSHPIVMKRDGEDLVAALAANGHLPDCDFIFTWKEKPPVTPVIRTWLDENRRGLLEIRLPASGVSATQSASVSVTLAPSSVAPVASPSPATAVSPSGPTRHSSQATRHNTSVPPDVYCLLDRSGSMQGANWTGACKALAAFIPRLHPDTRVWLTLFETDTRDYDAVPVRAGDIDFGPDGKSIHRHGTAGGTELVPALRHLEAKMREHSAGRATAVLLITDGEVGNEHGAVNAAKQLGCPVHLLGVAMTANDGLEAIARETGGRSVFVAPGEDIPAAVERFAPILRAPVVTGLTITPGWQTADESPLRNLCDGDDIVIAISATPDAPELSLTCTSTQVSGFSLHPSSDSTRHTSLDTRHYPLAGLIWARSRIRHLDASKRKDEALALAKQFNLLSRGAAFIAWDDAERVPVAQTEIVQPAMVVSERSSRLYCSIGADHMDYDAAPSSMRASHRGPRKAKAKTSPPPVPDIRAICKELLVTIETLRNGLPRLFHPQPLPGRLMDAIKQLHEFALAENNAPDTGEIAMLLIEQLRQELGQALAKHRSWLVEELARMNEQLAQLDAMRAHTGQLSDLQKHFRPLGV